MGTGWTTRGNRCRRCNGEPDKITFCPCSGRPPVSTATASAGLDAAVDAAVTGDTSTLPRPQAPVNELRGDGSVYSAEGETFRIRLGTAPSNTYVGSSRALAGVYGEVTLGPDDEVMDLPGGMFVAIADAGVMYRARYLEPKRHLFERGGNSDGIPRTAERARRPSRPEDWDLHNEYSYDDMTIGESWGAMDRVIKDN